MKHFVTSCMMSDDVNDGGDVYDDGDVNDDGHVNDGGDVNDDGDAQGGVRRRAQAGLQVGSHLHKLQGDR